VVQKSNGQIFAPSVENTQNQENVKLKLNKMRKEIADFITVTDNYEHPDLTMYSSESADGYDLYILKEEGVGRIVEEENVFIYTDDLIDRLCDEYIHDKTPIEIYVSEDLIEDLDLIEELIERFEDEEEEEYEDEDRKYDEYKDDKLCE